MLNSVSFFTLSFAHKFVGALSQHYDLVLRLSILPPAEDKQMWTYGGAGVPESGSGWVADVLATLPRHGVGRPDHEVVAALLGGLMLEASAGGLGPATVEDDVRARDVHGVSEAMLRWGTGDTETRPDEGFGVQNSDVI